MRNAIIGSAQNYSEEILMPFLVSLEKTGFSGDLILFINHKTGLISKNFSYQIKLVNFEDQNYKYILFFRIMESFSPRFIREKVQQYCANFAQKEITKKALPKWLFSQFYVKYYAATSRFMLYLNYLNQHKYDNIFITDTRDVIFQKDIFQTNSSNKVLVFEENSQVEIKDEPWNRGWIINGYGQNIFEQIKHKTFYCAGTILGDYDSVCQFLKDYLNNILTLKFPHKMLGIDQAALNYFIHIEALQYFSKIPSGKIIFTVGTHDINDIGIIEDKIYFTDFSNDLPSVIHQYDRHPVLKELVDLYYNHSQTMGSKIPD